MITGWWLINGWLIWWMVTNEWLIVVSKCFMDLMAAVHWWLRGQPRIDCGQLCLFQIHIVWLVASECLRIVVNECLMILGHPALDSGAPVGCQKQHDTLPVSSLKCDSKMLIGAGGSVHGRRRPESKPFSSLWARPTFSATGSDLVAVSTWQLQNDQPRPYYPLLYYPFLSIISVIALSSEYHWNKSTNQQALLIDIFSIGVIPTNQWSIITCTIKLRPSSARCSARSQMGSAFERARLCNDLSCMKQIKEKPWIWGLPTSRYHGTSGESMLLKNKVVL